MIDIILADDHAMFRDGLKEIFQHSSGHRVVGECSNGEEILQLLEKQSADLIILDISMPEMDGWEACRKLREDHPDLKILVCSMYDSPAYIQRLIKAGANGYILKNTGKKELLEAVDNLMKGESYYSREVTERIMESLQKQQQLKKDYRITELTDREKEVLILIANEFTTREIADKLFLSPHTVETYRKNLIGKLQVKNVSGLVKYAVLQGWVE